MLSKYLEAVYYKSIMHLHWDRLDLKLNINILTCSVLPLADKHYLSEGLFCYPVCCVSPDERIQLITSGPATRHHWEEPGSGLVDFFPSDIYTHWWNSPWAFTSLGWTVTAVSAFPHARRAPAPSSSSLWLFAGFSSMSVSLLYWGAPDQTQCSRCGLTSADYLPCPTGNATLQQREGWLILKGQ